MRSEQLLEAEKEIDKYEKYHSQQEEALSSQSEMLLSLQRAVADKVETIQKLEAQLDEGRESLSVSVCHSFPFLFILSLFVLLSLIVGFVQFEENERMLELQQALDEQLAEVSKLKQMLRDKDSEVARQNREIQQLRKSLLNSKPEPAAESAPAPAPTPTPESTRGKQQELQGAVVKQLEEKLKLKEDEIAALTEEVAKKTNAYQELEKIVKEETSPLLAKLEDEIERYKNDLHITRNQLSQSQADYQQARNVPFLFL
jgi:hypothetical protein